MKNYCPQIFTFIFFFCFTHGFAQDIIVKKDGAKIYCRIVDEDSVSIVYIRTAQRNRSIIKKSEVDTYFSTKNAKRKPKDLTSSKSSELLIIQVSAGLAIPIGDFGSKNENSKTAGLAKIGLILDAALILKLSKYFGFCADYRYQKNTVDKAVLEQSLSSIFPQGVSTSVKVTDWTNNGLFGGVYFNLPISANNNTSFDFSLLVGRPRFESPEIVLSASQKGSSISVNQSVGKTSALAGVIKMGIRYKFEKVALHAGLSFFTAKPSFKDVLIKDSRGAIVYTEFVQPMATVNLEAGMSFVLFR
ncbi:hypothetical protein [Aurantibacillus circumpalustris]|uniref:hypothetical protein n=1 Tax=Aurantibacillus circumpalustris TaxID=3036359 RepID=UPI00295AF664|nr:hypothetical protein [Aurantibacillus circumpalustris]